MLATSSALVRAAAPLGPDSDDPRRNLHQQLLSL
jgi:hypothetical protein